MKFFYTSMISPFKPSILVSNIASIESIFFCSSFMSLRISSPSSRVQVGFSGGLFGVEVPFFWWHVGQVSLLNLDFEVVLLDNIYSIVSPKFQPFWV
jgi:hypothetical protein